MHYSDIGRKIKTLQKILRRTILSENKAHLLLVDDDGENWMSGPWLEASHIATALNDGGYSYDVFRAGRWGGVAKELPAGDTGLSLVDDYEVIIWYSGWNTQIMSNAEQSVLSDYLDGDCGTEDNFCVPTTSRNIFVSTQMSDWFEDTNCEYMISSVCHWDKYYEPQEEWMRKAKIFRGHPAVMVSRRYAN